MKIWLSLSEVKLKSEKALRALNFPSGSEVENGKNICWLEACGLPGLQSLYEEIKINSKRKINHTPLEFKIKEDTVHCSGRNLSGFLLAQTAADFVETGKVFYVQDCRYPLLIFAEISRRTHLTMKFRTQWQEGDRINVASSIFGKTTVNFNSDNLFFAEKLKVSAAGKTKPNTSETTGTKKRISRSIGIGVELKYWELICYTANRLLVPDNELSHTSAGAEVDDNN